uniref:Uncharacterized protein n=1 Tax=Cannabis sativa TaxID=3483 RepID=A0A803Q6L3_CANSA
MTSTYSRAKSGVLKVTTIINNFKNEVEETKKKIELKSLQLGEVNKQLIAANKLIEDLKKENIGMPSTAQLEANNEALAKDVNLSRMRGKTSTLFSEF